MGVASIVRARMKCEFTMIHEEMNLVQRDTTLTLHEKAVYARNVDIGNGDAMSDSQTCQSVDE